MTAQTMHIIMSAIFLFTLGIFAVLLMLLSYAADIVELLRTQRIVGVKRTARTTTKGTTL
jgi:hypothetical protein